MKLKSNIAMLLVFLAVTLSPFLLALILDQELTVFDGITAAFLGVFALVVFVWWKKRKKWNADILDDADEDLDDLPD